MATLLLFFILDGDAVGDLGSAGDGVPASSLAAIGNWCSCICGAATIWIGAGAITCLVSEPDIEDAPSANFLTFSYSFSTL